GNQAAPENRRYGCADKRQADSDRRADKTVEQLLRHDRKEAEVRLNHPPEGAEPDRKEDAERHLGGEQAQIMPGEGAVRLLGDLARDGAQLVSSEQIAGC